MKSGDDIAILDPDITVTLAGEQVTVRELRFLEGLRVQAVCAGLLGDLAVLLKPETEADPSVDSLLEVFGKHPAATEELFMLSTGKPREWIRELGDEDGQQLLLAFWTANAGFFVRRLMTRVIGARVARERRSDAPSGSQTSTPH